MVFRLSVSERFLAFKSGREHVKNGSGARVLSVTVRARLLHSRQDCLPIISYLVKDTGGVRGLALALAQTAEVLFILFSKVVFLSCLIIFSIFALQSWIYRQ